MKAYLAIKFYEDNQNREDIEQICAALRHAGIDCTVLARDYEKWGEIRYPPAALMKLNFKVMDEFDLIIVEFSEKGVGIGIEAGYSYARNKKIFVIARTGSDISTTLQGIAKEVVFYDSYKDLADKFKKIKLE